MGVVYTAFVEYSRRGRLSDVSTEGNKNSFTGEIIAPVKEL